MHSDFIIIAQHMCEFDNLLYGFYQGWIPYV